MDPTLATLAPRSRVWAICEDHRVAQRGTIETIDGRAVTVKLPRSSLPPQRFDRVSGMWLPVWATKCSNTFFIRGTLPARFTRGQARPPYVVVDQETDSC